MLLYLSTLLAIQFLQSGNIFLGYLIYLVWRVL